MLGKFLDFTLLYVNDDDDICLTYLSQSDCYQSVIIILQIPIAWSSVQRTDYTWLS